MSPDRPGEPPPEQPARLPDATPGRDEHSTGEDLCPRCGGSGELDGKPCSECGGSGTVIVRIHES